MQIGRKIYYQKSTGNVILSTGECMGDVIETTTEQDFEMYEALKLYQVDAVGVTQLEYGQYREKFGVYNYSINKSTGAIVWGGLINPDVPIPQPTLEERLATLEQQNDTLQQQNLTLMDAFATMYETMLGV